MQAWLSLRQIIVCSPELIKAMAEAARALDVKIHTHLCEGVYEIDYALEKFGKRPTVAARVVVGERLLGRVELAAFREEAILCSAANAQSPTSRVEIPTRAVSPRGLR